MEEREGGKGEKTGEGKEVRKWGRVTQPTTEWAGMTDWVEAERRRAP